MPGLAVSLADALEIPSWEEAREQEPLKVELSAGVGAMEGAKEPLKVELPFSAAERQRCEEPQKVAVSPEAALSWDACLREPSVEGAATLETELPFGTSTLCSSPLCSSPMTEDCSAAGHLGETPLASPFQHLPFHLPLPDGSMPAPGAQECMAACLAESPMASAYELPYHSPFAGGSYMSPDAQDYAAMHAPETPLAASVQQMLSMANLPEVPPMPMDPQESECCEAYQAWSQVYEAETVAASPATSSGSDYEYSPDAEAYYPGCFDHARQWESMHMHLSESPCSLEECVPACIDETPLAQAMQFGFSMSPLLEEPPLPEEAEEQAGSLPSRGSALHGSQQCKPCAWFYKTVGCQSGFECDFCHLCPEGTLKAKKKTKQAMKRFSQSTGGNQDGNQQRFALSLSALI